MKKLWNFVKKIWKELTTYSEEREKKQAVLLYPIMVIGIMIFAISSVVRAFKETSRTDDRFDFDMSLMKIERRMDSLERDWKHTARMLETQREFVRIQLDLFWGRRDILRDMRRNAQLNEVIEENGSESGSGSFAKSAESLPEIDWGFLEIDTSAHEAELENALRERMSADEWAEREAQKTEESRWNEYFENAAPEEERALFKEAVERRFAAFMETYAAIEKANRSDDLGDAFAEIPEIEAAFAMSKKQMLEIIRADVAAQIRRQNGLIEKDGQVISDPDQAIGDVRLRTDYFVEMQKRQTMKHLNSQMRRSNDHK